jgi:hypothetical protein
MNHFPQKKNSLDGQWTLELNMNFNKIINLLKESIMDTNSIKRIYSFFIFILLLVMPFTLIAQPRYVSVPSGIGTLDETIAADTTGRQQNPNTIYLLERNGYYLTQSTISNVGYHLRIEGAPGAGADPIIRPGLLPDGITSSRCFNPKGDFTLKNVYLVNVDDHPSLPKVIQNGIRVGASGVRVVVDSCHIDYDIQSTIRLDNPNCKVYVTNSIFSNLGDMNGSNGRVCDTRGTVQDTIVIENNIIYNVAERMLRTAGARITYIRINNNTMVSCPQGDFAFGPSNEVHFFNNLMIDCGIIGEYPDDTGSILDADTLVQAGTQYINIHHNNHQVDNAITSLYPTIIPPFSIAGPVTQTPFLDSLTLWWVNNLGTGATNLSQDVIFTNGPPTPVNVMLGQHDTSIHVPNKPELPKGIGASIEWGQPHYVFNFTYPTSSPLYTAGTGGSRLGSYLDWGVVFTDVKEIDLTNIVNEYILFENYPNPFNPSTTIRYSIPRSSFIQISIYNSIGEKIYSLMNSDQNAGTYEVVWNGKSENGIQVASGVYFYELKTSEVTKVQKMMLLK